ncbi:MFS transporter [Gryllotalpicola reticulitermitis]|uniref:MFS transporter n=1 Tax=Gryllotalpicola reticulitermitis TaxID=1184153 RepID=A0ABV8QBR7_9MICO
MTDSSRPAAGGAGEWRGHARGSSEYRRILMALACAGIATFAQLYSPQGILPQIASSLRVTPDQSALLISAATIGLAVGVLPWSWVADRIGRLPAMRLSLAAATVLGFAVIVCPSFLGILVLRAGEGIALGGLPALALTYLQEEISPAHSALAAGTYVSGTTVGGLLGRIIAAPAAAVFGWRGGVGTVVVIAGAATVAFVLLTPAARGFRRAPAEHREPLLRLVGRQLRTPALLTLFAQGFLLMGGFVTLYNYLAFRLQAAPFQLPATITALLFFAYLAGTWSSRRAGSASARRGRLAVLLVSIAVMIAGILLTLVPSLWVIFIGLVVLTAGFFAAHSIASGWTAARAVVGRAQATSLYNLFYYLGSSVVGWAGGVVFTHAGWDATALAVAGLAAIAGCWAAAVLRSPGSSGATPRTPRLRESDGR